MVDCLPSMRDDTLGFPLSMGGEKERREEGRGGEEKGKKREKGEGRKEKLRGRRRGRGEEK